MLGLRLVKPMHGRHMHIAERYLDTILLITRIGDKLKIRPPPTDRRQAQNPLFTTLQPQVFATADRPTRYME
jgi:hypothetical protein